MIPHESMLLVRLPHLILLPPTREDVRVTADQRSLGKMLSSHLKEAPMVFSTWISKLHLGSPLVIFISKSLIQRVKAK